MRTSTAPSDKRTCPELIRSKSTSSPKVALSGVVSYTLRAPSVPSAANEAGGIRGVKKARMPKVAADIAAMWLTAGRNEFEPCRQGRPDIYRDASPELTQSLDPALRPVTDNQRCIDGADRDADDPGRRHTRFDQAFVHAGLVGPKRTTALKQQDLVIIPFSFHNPHLRWEDRTSRKPLSSLLFVMARRKSGDHWSDGIGRQP